MQKTSLKFNILISKLMCLPWWLCWLLLILLFDRLILFFLFLQPALFRDHIDFLNFLYNLLSLCFYLYHYQWFFPFASSALFPFINFLHYRLIRYKRFYRILPPLDSLAINRTHYKSHISYISNYWGSYSISHGHNW